MFNTERIIYTEQIGNSHHYSSKYRAEEKRNVFILLSIMMAEKRSFTKYEEKLKFVL